MQNKIIAHLDLDAFFASVEEAATPRFRGKPIVVGAEPNGGQSRGVVSTANYKAREYGIKSAMPIFKAWQLSEAAKAKGLEPVIFLPVDFSLYKPVSEKVFEIISKYSNSIEQASIDEFYFDLSPAENFKKAEEIGKEIKKEILASKKVTCSVGIAPNKFIAKIAAGFKKPDGLFAVEPEEAQDFLDPLNIREIPGIGPKTSQIFYAQNITTIKDLRQLSREELQKLAGKHGLKIYDMARGIGSAEITKEHEVKSIGEQTTFNQNTLNAIDIFEELKNLSNSVFNSFTASEFTSFKTITVIVRFSNFKTQTSSHTLKAPLNKKDKKLFELEILKLMLPFLDKRQNPKRKLIRLVGVRIEKLA